MAKYALRDGQGNIVALASASTKRLDAAWAVGSGNGGLDTGSIANTTYHIWLIKRTDTGVVDALFSASASSPTMPANYTVKRRIGSVIRVSAALKLFLQFGDHFMLKDPVFDVSVINLGTTATLYALTVPLGLNVEAQTSPSIRKSGATVTVNLWSPLLNDVSTGSFFYLFTDFAGGYEMGQFRIRVNTAAQIKAVSSAADTEFNVQTLGWWDDRGRND